HGVLATSQVGETADQLHLHGERDLRIEPLRQPRRGDTRGVGDRSGVADDAMTYLRTGQLFAGDVAGRDHQREPQLGAAILEEGKPLAVREPDADLVTGHDVADLDGEDVVALLLEQRRALSLIQRLGILAARLPSFLDAPADDALPDLHLETAHRAAA